jgi:hypothetical protein
VFSRYPSHLLAKAIDPCDGLPSRHAFPPSIKDAKDFLEPLHKHEIEVAELKRRREQQLLPAPARDPEADARIAAGFKDLGDVLRGSLKKIPKQGEEKLAD